MSYQSIRSTNLRTLDSGFGIFDRGRLIGLSLLDLIDELMINGRIDRSAITAKALQRRFGV